MTKFKLRDRVRIVGNPDVRTVQEIREISGSEILYSVQLGKDFVTRIWAKESDLERPDPTAPHNRICRPVERLLRRG
jgi:hypothetical protein